jgi:hypothetical protein
MPPLAGAVATMFRNRSANSENRLSELEVPRRSQANQVVGQRAIYSLDAEARSRLNGLYVALFFIGGATGSAIASLTCALGGWDRITWIGFAFPIAALALFATEFTTSGKGRLSRRGSASSGK